MKQIDEYWPMMQIDLQTITGACEVGKDLFLLGNFGGFGGILFEVHRDLDEAKDAAKEYNKTMKSHTSVYRLRVSLEDEMIGETHER